MVTSRARVTGRAGRRGARPAAAPRSPRLRAKVRAIASALEAAYGRPRPGEAKDPLSELVFTILSQHTSDTNRDRAWASLRAAFPGWEEAASAPARRLEEAIRVGGLARVKSLVIRQVLRQVKQAEGDYSLDRLRGLGMEEVESELSAFKGVGLKTIRCVQAFSLGQPAFPVDTHVHRVAGRLGLIPSRTSFDQAHRILGAAAPPEDALPLHLNLITHGRRVCRAQKPLCGACVLRRRCPFPLAGRPAGAR
ncbi:MAG TPA: endonuclease III [Candidatus Polarisedimenticolia bacterium]|nr:endonuclease III [Candidatus Polarisedimenticolia bacterium]